jgi:hypothetical protein
MTPEDREALRNAIREGIRQGLASIRAEKLAETEAPAQAAVEAAKVHAAAPVRTIREATKEILAGFQRGLDSISFEYSCRFDAVDRSQAATIVRLGKLEERVLAVGLRIPPQLPQH